MTTKLFLRELLLFVVILLSMSCLDFIWLTYIARNHMIAELGAFFEFDQNGHLVLRWWSVVAVYFTMTFGLYYFVLSWPMSMFRAAFRGGLYGFILYGTYEFTNHALLVHWPSSVIVCDLAWGVVLMLIAAVIGNTLNHKL